MNALRDVTRAFKRHISFHWQRSLIVQQRLQDNNKEYTKAPYYCSFFNEIQQLPVDPPHKMPVMRRAYPYHDMIMTLTGRG